MPKHKPNLADDARENPTYASVSMGKGPRWFDVTARDGRNTTLYKDVLHANVTWDEVDQILAGLNLQMDPSGGWRTLSGAGVLRARVVPADT